MTELSPVTHSLFSSISLSDPRDGRDTLSVRCSAAASRGFYGPALSPRRSLFVRRKPNGFPRDAWCDRLTLNASSGLCSLLLSSPVTPFRSWLLLVLRNFRGGVSLKPRSIDRRPCAANPILTVQSWNKSVSIRHLNYEDSSEGQRGSYRGCVWIFSWRLPPSLFSHCWLTSCVRSCSIRLLTFHPTYCNLGAVSPNLLTKKQRRSCLKQLFRCTLTSVFNKLAEVHWMHDVQEIKHIQLLVKHNAQIFNLKMNRVNIGIHYYFTLRFTQQFALKDN